MYGGKLEHGTPFGCQPTETLRRREHAYRSTLPLAAAYFPECLQQQPEFLYII